MILIKSLSDFNSIKVQLELKIIIKVALYALFQFHKGTIRTEPLKTGPILSLLFQFHKGTIRTNGFVRSKNYKP